MLHPPPQSPDISVVEHLWDRLEKQIRKIPIKSKQHLKERLQGEWQNMRKLVQSVPDRLAEVIKMKGNPTRYCFYRS